MVMNNVFSYIRVHYTYLLASIIIVLLLSSCGQLKQMEKSKTSVNIERYDSSALTTRINRVNTRATTELQKVTSHLKMRIVRKELSPPDSLGNQYVEAEVTIIATADEGSTIEADIAEEERGNNNR